MSVNWTTGLEGLAYPQAVMSPGLFTKYPVDDFDVTIDWTADGSLPAGDTIVSSTLSADEGISITPPAETAVFTDTTTTVWLSGGSPGWLYHVTDVITTAGGRTFSKILYVKVKWPL